MAPNNAPAAATVKPYLKHVKSLQHCFIYYLLAPLLWMPSKNQVCADLPDEGANQGFSWL
jgi:hypothetical protein